MNVPFETVTANTTTIRTNQFQRRTRVYVVDSQVIVQRAFAYLLEAERDMELCGVTSSAPVALAQILSLRPDLAILELVLKTGSGLNLIKQLRYQCAALKILVFSRLNEWHYIERAWRAGANGYLSKDEPPERVIEGIRGLMAGKPCWDQDTAARMMEIVLGGETRGRSVTDRLSNRELEVLQMVGLGVSSREIAQRLQVSIKTIESHREHLKVKLGLRSALELVNYAHDWVERGGA